MHALYQEGSMHLMDNIRLIARCAPNNQSLRYVDSSSASLVSSNLCLHKSSVKWAATITAKADAITAKADTEEEKHLEKERDYSSCRLTLFLAFLQTDVRLVVIVIKQSQGFLDGVDGLLPLSIGVARQASSPEVLKTGVFSERMTILWEEETSIRHSLVPRPRPAFHRLQYEKAWRAWYLFSHEQTGWVSHIVQLTTRSTLDVYDNRSLLARYVW